jgi:hypothetical protein
VLNKQQWTALQDVTWVVGCYRRDMLDRGSNLDWYFYNDLNWICVCDDSVLWPIIVSVVLIILLSTDARNLCVSGMSCELRETAL